MWGVLAASIFSYNKSYIKDAYGDSMANVDHGKRVVAAIVAVVVIALWTLINSGCLFGFILLVALQLVIGGLVDLEILSINENFKKYF